MTANQYRQALAALGLSQIGAARVMGVTERTSRRYAAGGVPEKTAAWVREKLAAYKKEIGADNEQTPSPHEQWKA